MILANQQIYTSLLLGYGVSFYQNLFPILKYFVLYFVPPYLRLNSSHYKVIVFSIVWDYP